MKTKITAIVIFLVARLAYGGDLIVDDGMSLKRFAMVMEKVTKGEKLTDREDCLMANGSGYLIGFIEACSYGKAMGASFPQMIPANVSVGQLAIMIDKFLSEHPEKLNESAIEIVGEVTAKAFPNPKFKAPGL